MAAEKIAETDEEIIDLTELIEKGEAAGAVPPPEKASEELSAHMQSLKGDSTRRSDMKNDAPPRQDDTEIDALLAQMEAQDDNPEAQLSPEEAAAPSHKVDPHEKLDMSDMGDVDKLLSTLDIPPQPRERNAEAAQQVATVNLDSAVDDLLDAMNGSAPKPEAENPPDAQAPVASQPAEQDFAADLDALLGGLAPTASASQQAEPVVSAPQTAPPAPEAEPRAREIPEKHAPDMEEDLDALLAAIAPDADMPQAPAASANAPAPETPLDAGPQAAPDTPAETGPDMTADLDALLGGLAPTASASQQAEPVVSAPQTAPPAPEAEPRAREIPEKHAPDMEEDLDAMREAPAPNMTADVTRDMMPDMPNQAKLTNQADQADKGAAAPDGEAFGVEDSGLPLPEQSPEAAAETPPATETEPPAPPVEELLPMPHMEEGAPVSAQADAPLAEAPAGPAPTASAAKATRPTGQDEGNARLSERLQHCESELAEAKARIAALEKAAAAPAASLEDLLREGSPLHDRFAALIASSVSQALKEMPAPAPDEVLGERLHALNLMGKSVSARMDALESRLDTLEPHFNQQVEKAAAGAAARILREEIARLVQG